MPETAGMWAAGVVGVMLFFPLLRMVTARSVPKVIVPPSDEAEASDKLTNRKRLAMESASPKDKARPAEIVCWDPCTMQELGTVKAFTEAEVKSAVARARKAQEEWAAMPFSQREHTLRVLLRAVLDNLDTIVRVACRDSGKTKVDAVLGEVLTTCEKLRWTIGNAQQWLKPEYRESGPMNLHKTSRVEYTPVGVVGAIVAFNYPFHNVLNPVISSIITGNGIVVKGSEYTAWSTKYYSRLVRECLAASGAPLDLVQIVTGFEDAGKGVIEHTDKVIFIGSVGVGSKVQQHCGRLVKPVVLELGGKDPMVVCDDASPKKIAQLVCRAAFQNMGQNCAGPERYVVYDKVYDDFIARVLSIVQQMRQGDPLSSPFVDCGACVIAAHLKYLQGLVDEAVKKGAKIMTGGYIPIKGSRLAEGQFYPPTILSNCDSSMRIMQEEIFGPVMCIARVKSNTDEEAIEICNKCEFALGAAVFSSSKARASRMIKRIHAGMGAVNDLEGVTYLSQSLPFGGHKQSGFDRFAGPEGLRGLCNVKSIAEDRFVYHGSSFMPFPAEISYPSTGQGQGFLAGLMGLLYGYGLSGKIGGLFTLLKASVTKPKMEETLPNHLDDVKESKKA